MKSKIPGVFKVLFKKNSQFIFFLLFSFFLFGCSKNSEDSITEPDPTNDISLPLIQVNGNTTLPAESGINYSELTAVNFSETQLSSEGQFNIEIPDGFYTFTYIIDPNDNIIAMAYQSSDEHLNINSETTALALLMSIPIPWEALGANRSDIMTSLKQNSHYSQLVSYMNNLMKNDPRNILNFEQHPQIIETVVRIVSDVISANSLISSPSVYRGASLETDGSKLTVVNPRNCPYGVSGFNLNGNPNNIDDYLFEMRPVWIESKGIIGLFTGPSSREIHLENGNYLMVVGKVSDDWLMRTINPIQGSIKDFKDLRDFVTNKYVGQNGDYLEAVKHNARIKGNLGFAYEFLFNLIGIIPAKGDAIQLAGFILEELINTTAQSPFELDLDLRQIVAEKSLPKIIVKGLKDDIGFRRTVLRLFRQDARTTKGLRILGEKLNRLLIVTDVMELLISIFDFYLAQDVGIYTISKTNNGINLTESLPPSEPQITLSTAQPKINEELLITIVSTDPENKQIKYSIFDKTNFTFQESNYLSSGQSYTFIYSNNKPGYVSLVLQAIDKDGAHSTAIEKSIYFFPESTLFSEDFESYEIGTFQSPLWNTEFELPSKVLISGNGYQSNKSVKFIDYDPAIGQDSGKFAVISTVLQSNATSLMFYLKAENVNDGFGIRAVQDVTDYWNTMAYYVLIHEGSISYYDNQNTFHSIQPFVANKWYKIKLVIDWQNQKYNIFIDDILKVPDIAFRASVSSAPNLFALAFSDDQCRGAYLDGVRIEGSTMVQKPNYLIRNMQPNLLKKSE